ncbi:hypothetical protein GCM10007079_35730 [Nocardiopsis terrae]|uniref:Uncharacterized protein n=1 Tax=Nocardiopsis terrae TaxID=372655 RepID=A0ABR9HD84_9ACTN|nr:hypothetical protein [Nocardiopsis terrae]MBE1456970.1 hypothetical protein [Nocardiopsis terrae]GHC89896.1 hypothetical protein GCM10007079_35730 [Nocardiopsis terrae]
MQLRIDPDRQSTPFTCGHCSSEHLRICGFVNNEHGAFAVYYAHLYNHGDVHEAYVDIVMDDDWKPGSPLEASPKRTTFGCRVGPVEGSPAPACSLVQAAEFHEGDPFYGDRLDRERALPHPWLPLFWDTVDHLLEHEPDVNAHVYCVNAATQED